MLDIIFAYFVLIMFGAAFQPKALGASVVCGLGLVAAAGDVTKSAFIFLLYIPAFLVASFRG